MKLKINNKEQLILEVAEKHFIEKGYMGAKTTEIADSAGVNHALLHYYYRTKENLFSQIFEQKAAQLLECFAITFDSDLPFFEKIKNGIETHFEFLSNNPKLPLFILREIVSNKERKKFFLNKIFPVSQELYQKFNYAVQNEIQTGFIRPVKTINLLLNIVSLNVFAFVAAQIFFDMDSEKDKENLLTFLDERKKSNIELIINSLKQ